MLALTRGHTSSMALGVPDIPAHLGLVLGMELTSHVPGREFLPVLFDLLTSTDLTCPAHRSTDWLREPKQPDCGLYACGGRRGVTQKDCLQDTQFHPRECRAESADRVPGLEGDRIGN